MVNRKFWSVLIGLMIILTVSVVIVSVNKQKDTIEQREVSTTEENFYDGRVLFPYGEEEPITMEECGEIYYANQEDFETIKDYVNSLNIKEDSVSIKTDEENIDEQIKQSFLNLKNCGVKHIRFFRRKDSDITWIIFFIDGTSSSEYGVIWRNHNNKFSTSEDKLADDWYSYAYLHV